MQTQCLICRSLSYISESELKNALSLSDEVARMLTALINKLTAAY